MKTNTPLVGYVPLSQPTLAGGDPLYLQKQLQAISQAIQDLVVVAPQAAVKVPPVLIDGMIRLARSPWYPVSGQTADGWVYYDSPTASWNFL